MRQTFFSDYPLHTRRGHPSHLLVYPLNRVIFASQKKVIYTDNGFAERFVGVFKLAVAERRPYLTLGEFLRAAEAWVNFYNRERPHESLGYRSPNQFAQANQLQTLPYLAVF
jgi:Integrase core domain